MNRDLVLAGNYRQFLYYCRINELNPRQLHYIGDTRHLRGIRGMKLIRTGTWYERGEVAEMAQELERMGYFSEVVDA